MSGGGSSYNRHKRTSRLCFIFSSSRSIPAFRWRRSRSSASYGHMSYRTSLKNLRTLTFASFSSLSRVLVFSASSLASLTASNFLARVSRSLLARSIAACFSLTLIVQGCSSFCLTSIWSWKERVLSVGGYFGCWNTHGVRVNTFQAFLDLLQRLFLLCKRLLVFLNLLGLALCLCLVLFDGSFRFGK